MEPTIAITHQGPWDAFTRAVPALAFIERYATKVDSLDLSEPFQAWYAPSSRFYNADGVVYNGGEAIWNWMKALFGKFSAAHHDIHTARLISSPGNNNNQWVMLETTTTFTFKTGILAGEPVKVPRLLMFLVGNSDGDGRGTDGKQIWEAKTYWDMGFFGREAAAREKRLGDA